MISQEQSCIASSLRLVRVIHGRKVLTDRKRYGYYLSRMEHCYAHSRLAIPTVFTPTAPLLALALLFWLFYPARVLILRRAHYANALPRVYYIRLLFDEFLRFSSCFQTINGCFCFFFWKKDMDDYTCQFVNL